MLTATLVLAIIYQVIEMLSWHKWKTMALGLLVIVTVGIMYVTGDVSLATVRAIWFIEGGIIGWVLGAILYEEFGGNKNG